MNNMQINLNIYIDGLKMYSEQKSNTITIKDVKSLLRERLEFYSINYIIKSNDRDYTNLDTFKLMELFPMKKTIELYVTQVKTLIKEEKQKVLMTYSEGGNEILIFLLESKKFIRKIPEFDLSLKFEGNQLPYNSRYCNYIKENKLVLTGGIGFENGCCIYDYDINYISNMNKLNNEYQCHSNIIIGEKVFCLGGYRNKTVECFDMIFEDWIEYPNLHFDRADPGVSLINNDYLIVFSGYSILKGEFLGNFEKLDLSYEPFKKDWDLLSIYDIENLGTMRSHMILIPNKNKNSIYILGGLGIGTAYADGAEFSLFDYKLTKLKLKLPFETAFGQKFGVNDEEGKLFNFTYGNNQLIVFDMRNDSIYELLEKNK